jgi:hypothetical protein
MKHLDDGNTTSGKGIPCAYRPSGDIMAGCDLRLFGSDNLPDIALHHGIITVDKMPDAPVPPQRTFSCIREIDVADTSPVDLDPVNPVEFKPSVAPADAERRYRMAAPEKPYGKLMQCDFRPSPNVGHIEAVEKKNMHKKIVGRMVQVPLIRQSSDSWKH